MQMASFSNNRLLGKPAITFFSELAKVVKKRAAEICTSSLQLGVNKVTSDLEITNHFH